MEEGEEKDNSEPSQNGAEEPSTSVEHLKQEVRGHNNETAVSSQAGLAILRADRNQIVESRSKKYTLNLSRCTKETNFSISLFLHQI